MVHKTALMQDLPAYFDYRILLYSFIDKYYVE